MKALLEALEKDPAVAIRRRAMTVAAVLLPIAVGLGVRQSVASHQLVCNGAADHLADVWELTAPGAESSRQAAIHRAFLASGKSYAADVWASVRRILGSYAQNWTTMYREACEATHVRGEQSAEVLDLRMSCLQERLGGLRALTEVYSAASGAVVENAVSAANTLGGLERCADVPLLRAVVRPPRGSRDARPRRRIAPAAGRGSRRALRLGQPGAAARGATDALAAEARALGYQPLTAEALALVGHVRDKLTDGVGSSKAFEEAFWQADAARDDDVRADAAVVARLHRAKLPPERLRAIRTAGPPRRTPSSVAWAATIASAAGFSTTSRSSPASAGARPSPFASARRRSRSSRRPGARTIQTSGCRRANVATAIALERTWGGIRRRSRTSTDRSSSSAAASAPSTPTSRRRS